jgi:hypothetical protein
MQSPITDLELSLVLDALGILVYALHPNTLMCATNSFLSTLLVESFYSPHLLGTNCRYNFVEVPMLIYPYTSPLFLTFQEAIAKNIVYHARTKHIEVQHDFVLEKVAYGAIILEHCLQNYMLADVLIKALARNQFVT